MFERSGKHHTTEVAAEAECLVVNPCNRKLLSLVHNGVGNVHESAVGRVLRSHSHLLPVDETIGNTVDLNVVGSDICDGNGQEQQYGQYSGHYFKHG